MFWFLLSLQAAVTAVTQHNQPTPWMIKTDPPRVRALALLNAMNMSEKLHMLHGNNSMKPYVGAVAGSARLKIPALTLNDGPQGFRDNDGHPGTSTQWPSALNIAATWDPTLAMLWGKSMGTEFLGKGSNVQLGPGMCLERVPYNGRNFEYISGEDPILGYYMAKAAVEGIQSTGVIANAKHWVLNSQETNRTTQSAEIDNRTFHEMYLPPFEGAIAGGVGSIMCSYNKIWGQWSCEHPDTLAHTLRDQLGFQGFVMSDWGATHSASINAGLDMEMPGASKMNGEPNAQGVCQNDLCKLIANGTVSEATINASVLRILTPMFQMGLFDRAPPNLNDIANNVTSESHNAIARQLSAASIVLLQNRDNVLPLKIQGGNIKKIAVLGTPAMTPVTGGGGSGSVSPYYQVAPLDVIVKKMSQLNPSPPPPPPSCGQIYNNSDINGHDLLEPPAKLPTAEACCQLCQKTSKCVAYSYYTSGLSCYLKSAVMPKSNRQGQIVGLVDKGNTNTSGVIFDDGTNMTRASMIAAAADVAIIFASTKSGEGKDREDLSLYDGWNGDNSTYSYDELIDFVSGACSKKNTPVIVVMVSPGAVLTPWRGSVDGILAAFMPGQEYGNAIADVLFGDSDATGRLPITFPDHENQWGFTTAQWPGINDVSVYSEKLEVGYRYYDAHTLTPAFPFGHGLSYTTFSYSDLKTSSTSVSFTLQNNGTRTGTEVVQLYLEFPSDAEEPPMQLKAFQSVKNISVGQSIPITFQITPRAVSVWSESQNNWTVAHGKFGVHVGRSSRDIKLSGSFTI
eukprot:m.7851 g.7851  ORF g.7851 m.7851 type:complete len:794 (-) comp3793_c0_seq1:82-2463(-)